MTVWRWLTDGFDATGGGDLVFTVTGLPLWAAAVVSIVVLWLAWRTAAGIAGRWLQVVLLAPVAAALLWAVAMPVWVQSHDYREEGRFAVLLDNSRSMSVKEQGGLRGEALPAALQAVARPAAERFLFDRELVVGGEPRFDGQGTDLAQALGGITERYAGERLAGIALLTDGLDAGGLRAAWSQDGVVHVPALPGPLTIYGIGDGEGLNDLSITSVATGGFAFIRAPFTLTAGLAGAGYAGREVLVTLTRDGSLEARKTVRLDAKGEAQVAFQVTPTRVGRFTYEVSVPVAPDDSVPGNNSFPSAVRVVRDRMRVLQVCGAPSADQKFMRLFLKQDPAVDLVSFFIMRTDQDMGAGYDSNELSLIPFPYEQLFSGDLWSFDLVIFQNFNYEPYFGWRSDQLLANVAEFVREGGAFIMIGGDRSFDLGKYADTALADILPVVLGVAGDPVDTGRFLPSLTEAGRRHPITALAVDSQESEAVWARLSPLDGVNLSRGVVPEAAVLLTHPDRKTASGEPLPVVAIRTVEKGRSLAFMGDSSWRWSFAEAGRGHGNQAYLRFWKQAMRWLVGDPDSQRLMVETALENYHVGDEVRVVARVRDVGFRPLAGVTVKGQTSGPSFTAPEAGAFEVQSTDAGEAVATLKVGQPGAHRVRVEAHLPGGERVEAETVFAVTTREAELEEIRPDMAFLQALATASGGRFYPPGTWGPPLEDEDAGRWVQQDKETPLWDIPLLPLLVGLFGSASWWIRRRGGAR